MILENIVKNIGLTQKEAKVYLACLELGPSPASSIASRAKFNRVSTYDILEKLLQKGFVNFVIQNKIKYFNPTRPQVIAHEVERKTQEFKKALPELNRLYGETSHPRVRYLEGIDGIKAIYADTLTSKTEILNYANSKEIRDHWTNYDKEYVEKRAGKKIFLRGIAPMDQYGEKVHKEDKKYYRDIRLVPAKKFDFGNEINIYDDKVAIISFKEDLIGMIIESHEIANTQRAIFKMAWEFARMNARRKHAH